MTVWTALALTAVTTGLLLVAEIFSIWIGPVTFIVTRHGPKSGILGGLSALLNGEMGYGAELIFYGLTRGVPGKINITLLAILLGVSIYVLFLPKRSSIH